MFAVIVDRNIDAAELIKQLFFEIQGWDVQLFTTGQQLIDQYPEQPVDLLITDGTGPDFVPKLRPLGFDAPVLVVTGGDLSEKYKVRARAAGIQHFLAEVYAPKDLLKKVSEILLERN